MRIKIIINPFAGIQQRNLNKIKRKFFLEKEDRTEKQIRNFFKKEGVETNICRTEKPGDATKMSGETKGYDTIIVAGGDGTINEVINGIKNYDVKIGIIPLGSENVTAKELKIPLQTKKACQIILKGKTKKIDIGVINEKKFLFAAGIGFDAHAIKNVQPILKKFLGKHSYTLAAMKTLFEHKPEELKIKINDKIEETGYFAIITNVKRYGGNIKIAEQAELDDGYLDLCIFKNKDLWSVIKYLAGAAKRQISGLKDIKTYKIKKAKIISKKKVLYHADAEIGGTTPAKVHVLPKTLKIITS